MNCFVCVDPADVVCRLCGRSICLRHARDGWCCFCAPVQK